MDSIWSDLKLLVQASSPSKIEEILNSYYLSKQLTDAINISSVSANIFNSCLIIKDLLRTHSFDSIAVSFNGGKDCTVLLALMLACIDEDKPLQLLYLHNEYQFEEEREFVSSLASRIGFEKINLIQVRCTNLKEGVRHFLTAYPFISVLCLGVRSIDPHSSELKITQMTDSEWPPVLRIHPLLAWTYSDIWSFLRLVSFPYCELYDKGYTSIGRKDKTIPNPVLKDPSFPNGYKPAYTLSNDALERIGRI